jgi:hypothetical protein
MRTSNSRENGRFHQQIEGERRGKTEPLLPLSLTQVYNATFRFAAVQNRE